MGHDQLFKTLFQTFLADLLSLAEPEALGFLDLSRVRFLDKETFTFWPEGERREVDLLATVPVRGSASEGDRYLLHVEIEAEARSGMDDRLWRYDHVLLARYGFPVLTLLVNLRGGEPGVSRRTVPKRTSYREISALHYTVFNLAGCPAEEYLARPEPLAWGLAALMRPVRLGRAELKMECLRRIAALDLDDIRSFLLANCVETYLELTPEETAEFEALRPFENLEVRVMEMTWADKMMEKGRVEGLEQGLRQGLAQGQATAVQALRRVVLQQLGQRFGPVPEPARRHVTRIDSLERLTEIATKLLTARSLDDLGLA